MLLCILLLQVAGATPVPAPAKPAVPPVPTPIARGPRTLSEYARERRLSGSTSSGGSFSVASTTAPVPEASRVPAPSAEASAAARAAQKRMDKAVRAGKKLDENPRKNGSRRDAARVEWDAAHEECRRTPGCRPVPRDDGARKWLKTDEEILDDYARENGMTRGTGRAETAKRRQ
ncbi:MAG: hypothetical protein EDX89_15740 [Acidobacteria bacterium]|nr:MAG: hypothetical protein EDX89_15740 [Acidobacteriota bacterium]